MANHATQLGNLALYSGWQDGDGTSSSDSWTGQINANFDAIDFLCQAVVISSTVTAPPASPANGDSYLLPTGCTGAWSGQDGKFAVWVARNSAWSFIVPKTGWTMYDKATSKRLDYDGITWKPIAAVAPSPAQFLARLSDGYASAITTQADSIVPVSVIVTDNSNGFSATSHSYTVPTGLGGTWLIEVSVKFGPHAECYTIPKIFINGSEHLAAVSLQPSTVRDHAATVIGVFTLAAGDVVAPYAYSDSNPQIKNGTSLVETFINGVRLGA